MHMGGSRVKRSFDEGAAPSARGEAEPRQQAAKVLAFLEVDRPAVDFSNIAHDCEAKAGPGLARRIEPGAPLEQLAATFLGNSWAVILDEDVHFRSLWLDRYKHPSAAIFGGIFDEVAEHL